MSVGIDCLKELLGNVSATAVMGIKTFKKIPAIQSEIKDLDVPEIVQLVTLVVASELPKLIEALRAK